MKNIIIILCAFVAFLYGNETSNLYAQSHTKTETTKFIFPAGCHYGQDCWAVNYVDIDPSEGVQDFKCNAKSYDAHKGTDFALASAMQMRKGVDVLAAAKGRVLRVRDGENDILKTKDELEDIKDNKKECGNGILIDHGDGLQTIYCHLKQGSITVKPKQRVKPGQKIGQIGQSGLAEFPHLHFGVMWEGSVIDPYTGALNTQDCDDAAKDQKESLWLEGLPMAYEPVAIFDGGFQTQAPDFKAIQRGAENLKTVSTNSAAFVFWSGFYNVEAGDEINLRITDPDGALFTERKAVLEQTRARQYYYTGRKIGRVQLKSGEYKGHVQIKRGGDEPIIREKIFSVTVR